MPDTKEQGAMTTHGKACYGSTFPVCNGLVVTVDITDEFRRNEGLILIFRVISLSKYQLSYPPSGMTKMIPY